MSSEPTPSSTDPDKLTRESKPVHGGTSPATGLSVPDGPAEQTDVSGLHSSIMREQVDPRDGYEPIPLWLVTVFAGFLFWGGYYLATYNVGFRWDHLDGAPIVLGAESIAAGPVDPMVLGKRLYTSNCVSCHQASGAGVAGQYPPLAASEWVVSDEPGTVARLSRILLHGLEGPITVKGNSYNGNMPGFGAKLKDHQIAAIMTYIRGNQEWGNSAPAVEEAQVAAARAATGVRALPWHGNEILGIYEDDAVPAGVPVTAGASTDAPAAPAASPAAAPAVPAAAPPATP